MISYNEIFKNDDLIKVFYCNLVSYLRLKFFDVYFAGLIF